MRSFLIVLFSIASLAALSQPKKPAHTTMCWALDQKETRLDTAASRGLADNFRLWETGKELSVFFIAGSEKLKQQIMAYAKTWEQYANIKFVQAKSISESHVRVLLSDEAFSSYIGTLSLSVPSTQPTMWLDTFYTKDARQFKASVIHEFGHVLGLMHEHQHPLSGIQWNREKIYENVPYCVWTGENTERDYWDEFLTQAHSYYSNGTAYDNKSIMHYAIPAWMTKNGYSTGWNFELSTGDKELISRLYPKNGQREPDQAVRMQATVKSIEIKEKPGQGYVVRTQGKFLPETDGTVYFTVLFYDSLGYALEDDDDNFQIHGNVAAVEKIQLKAGQALPGVIEIILPYDQLKVPAGTTKLIAQARIYHYSTEREELKGLYYSKSTTLKLPVVKLKPVATALPKGHQQSARRILSVPIVQQRTLVWCWLAVGEMLFRYYRVPAVNNNDYQCGIIGLIYRPCYTNCTTQACIIPSGSNYGTVNMLRQYPLLAASRNISFSEGKELSLQSVVNNINAGRPIVCGISPTNRAYYRDSEHAVIIAGYDISPNSYLLVVNDPYPYPSGQNPYLRNGGRQLSGNQYLIPYSTFTVGMCWNWSASNIRL